MTGSATHQVAFEAGGRPAAALVHLPETPCPRPALLIHLTGEAQASLDGPAVRRVPDVFLAAGHAVASFDLPLHGVRADSRGRKLVGMAAAVREGEDVFADIQRHGGALIDHALRMDVLRGAPVVLNGISRGGLAALHVMAADARVLACAIHAPVTWLPALTEFRDLADNPIIRRSNALALADRLAGRSLFVAIGNTDARVGADHARALCERLRSGVVTADVEEFTMPGDSHKAGFPEELGCQAGAAFLLHRIARKAKEDLWRNKP